ncbi:hypothetical protein BDM02DRAFT_3261810 [Thelephora ganbajun]|uniref:Uncharacterized protein n=1 Tax=Thelephora ganbajun TaxID=370292 RepID=A0ACB6ZC42_THEGA|nr:hypothetical protein BDM02DRAFT_3261810 [Thelephora ganbajun]
MGFASTYPHCHQASNERRMLVMGPEEHMEIFGMRYLEEHSWGCSLAATLIWRIARLGKYARSLIPGYNTPVGSKYASKAEAIRSKDELMSEPPPNHRMVPAKLTAELMASGSVIFRTTQRAQCAFSALFPKDSAQALVAYRESLVSGDSTDTEKKDDSPVAHIPTYIMSPGYNTVQQKAPGRRFLGCSTATKTQEGYWCWCPERTEENAENGGDGDVCGGGVNRPHVLLRQSARKEGD